MNAMKTRITPKQRAITKQRQKQAYGNGGKSTNNQYTQIVEQLKLHPIEDFEIIMHRLWCNTTVFYGYCISIGRLDLLQQAYMTNTYKRAYNQWLDGTITEYSPPDYDEIARLRGLYKVEAEQEFNGLIKNNV